MNPEIPVIQDLSAADLRLSAMMKALGNPVRFQIMQFLAGRQMCITGDIVEFTKLAQSTVSQHLKVLRQAGLIEGEIEGPATCYCISQAGIQFLRTQIDRWVLDCCPVDQANSESSNCR